MRRIVLVVAGVALAVLFAYAAVKNTVSSSQPGSPTVYQQIDTSTSCADLQDTFDRAASNTDRLQDAGRDADTPMSYMDAADSRMSDLGCYG